MKLAEVLFLTALITALIGVSSAESAAEPAASPPGAALHRYNLLGEGVGAVGYDVVSYFPEGGGRPRKGLIGISQVYDGVTYRFATQENLDRFKKDPARYVPAYGGWCAWAVAELNKRVDVDPESFEILGGRLLLFYRDPGLDTHSLWLQKPQELLAQSEANWPALAR